jgi:predicted signal transduction protein with EAL and GGDEF domain
LKFFKRKQSFLRSWYRKKEEDRLKTFSKVLDANKELWLLLSMFAIAALLNFVLASHHVLLGFYGLPVLFSAYFYGRRHAVMTAVASVLIVLLLVKLNPYILQAHVDPLQKWLDFVIWAGILVVTAYGMGTLHEHKTVMLCRSEKQGIRLEQLLREVTLQQEIAVAANRASSLEDTLRFALDRVCAYTGWELGHVYFCKTDESGRVAVPTALWHSAQQFPMQSFRLLSESASFPSGTGLPGMVIASGGPEWISDVTQDPSFLRAAAARECGLHAAFAFPLLVGNEVVAVLEFFSIKAAELDTGLIKVVANAGTQLGRVFERKSHEDKLIHDAFHDPLTKLPNRALFLDRLAHCIGKTRRHPEYKFAVLFVDLDRFKMVNDSLGHLAGDQLIVEIAQRLMQSLRRVDIISRLSDAPGAVPRVDEEITLARLGGDEFTILLEDIGEASDSVRVAERIQQALASPFLISLQEVFSTASIGIALSETGYSAAEDMLRDADNAMYRAKTLGGSRCEIFDPGMHAGAVGRLKLETDLRRALDREEFCVYYQPIVSLQDFHITGFEALVRWKRPGFGVVMPGDFIPLAEESDLIVLIGKWVLQEACRQMSVWNLQFPSDPPLTIAVNVSSKQFAEPDLVSQIGRVLRDTGLDPRSLKVEVTESVSMRDAERTARTLCDLNALGVRSSIDDFGTGYSSLSYLRRFPLDTLKIDRSFISDMNNNNESLEVVKTIMTLAHKIGLVVVAEGVETPEQADQLKSLACESAQGYFFSKPLNPEQVGQELFARAAGSAPLACADKL